MNMIFIKNQWENNRKNFIIAGIVLAVIIVIFAVFLFFKGESDRYYAVFLVNNQVYFGNLSDVNDRYVTLTNASYLQSQDQNDQSKVGLVRRGTEIHLPTGTMKINQSNVLFIEELTKNSPVAISIREYKKSQSK